MNTHHELTALAQKNLVTSLESFRNVLSIPHTDALLTLVQSMTDLAVGKLTGRWAFPIPTGCGKTRAIIDWCASMTQLHLPYSVAVASSRIDALITLRDAMTKAGIPEFMIGLLHESPDKKVKSNSDGENQDRQILLMSHQMIRSSESNLTRYNSYQGHPRNLLIYDESLLTTDTHHFGIRPLCAAIAHVLELIKKQEQHTEISNYLTEVKHILEAAEDNFFDGIELRHVDTPFIHPNTAAYYEREWRKYGMISQFLQAANLRLRLLRAGSHAVVSYEVVMPDELKNVLVLDASFPIRKLCKLDDTLQDATVSLGLNSDIKRFDHVELYRLKSYGGRHSMEARFKDKQMVREVVKVIKELPTTDRILCFVYKLKDRVNYKTILLGELEDAGVDTSRIYIETYGNETSLNDYHDCQHVFLIGILHRAETELTGQYLAQTRNLDGVISRELVDDISLSEKAHVAYQALSRGCLRVVNNGQAQPMKGYIVEIDPAIETELSKVMPGVQWKTWKPMFLPETDSLVDTLQREIYDYLMRFDGDRISSRKLKKVMGKEKVAPSTWKRSVRSDFDTFFEKVHLPKGCKEHGLFPFRLEGASFVRIKSKTYGFHAA